MMPNKEFDGVWESLVYDSEIKPEVGSNRLSDCMDMF